MNTTRYPSTSTNSSVKSDIQNRPMIKSLYMPGYAGLPKPSPSSLLNPPSTVPTVNMTMNPYNPGYGYGKMYQPVLNDNYQSFPLAYY